MDCVVQGKRVEIRLRQALLSAIDEWRRHQPDLPPRAEAVVRLAEMGLELATKRRGKLEPKK